MLRSGISSAVRLARVGWPMLNPHAAIPKTGLRRCLRTSSAQWHEPPQEKAAPVRQRDEFNEKLLDLLVCPLSKTPLRYDKENQELICDELKVAYPIVNGVPNLIPSCGRKLD